MKHLRVGIAGYGAIGRNLATALDQNQDGIELTAIAVRNPQQPPDLSHLRSTPTITDIAGLEALCDLVIECAPASQLAAIATPFLKAGKQVLTLSSGALLNHPELIELAKQHGGTILIPTGALLGLDAVSAAAQGQVNEVRMITRKPPAGLVGAPYLEQHQIDVLSLQEPTKIFDGTAREAAVGFPANLNVAVSLSLAGIGPDKTRLEIWADPTVTRNIHRIQVDSDAAILSMEIQNIPSSNPRTGRITAQSVIALLRKINAPLRVGT